MFKDIPTDVIQLIVNCLDANGFYAFMVVLKNIYGTLVGKYIDKYIKKRHNFGKLPIDGNHKMTQEYIDRGLVDYKDVIIYAGKYDLPRYIHFTRMSNEYDGLSPTNCEFKGIGVFQLPPILSVPKIVKQSYLHYNLRLPSRCLSSIFMGNNIGLMQLVQNYPEKSNVTIGDYTGRYNDLWKLNYKHKLAHLVINYDLLIWCSIGIPFIGYAEYCALKYFNRDCPLFIGALTISLGSTLGLGLGVCSILMRNKVLQLKLPL